MWPTSTTSLSAPSTLPSFTSLQPHWPLSCSFKSKAHFAPGPLHLLFSLPRTYFLVWSASSRTSFKSSISQVRLALLAWHNESGFLAHVDVPGKWVRGSFPHSHSRTQAENNYHLVTTPTIIHGISDYCDRERERERTRKRERACSWAHWTIPHKK